MMKGHEMEKNIPPLVDNIEPAVKRALAKHPAIGGDGIIPYAIEENIWQSVEDLFKIRESGGFPRPLIFSTGEDRCPIKFYGVLQTSCRLLELQRV